MSDGFVGVGLRPTHYSFLEHALTSSEKIHAHWFEAVSENYMDSEGRPLQMLLKVRESYPVALHGVSLSIGSTDPLNEKYLTKLKRLVEKVQPFIISDHLCWAGAHGRNLHDLLPLRYSNEVVDHVVARISRVQEFLGRPLTLENVSAYVRFEENDYTEWDFVNEIAKRSGCTLLFDINNLYVNAKNHDFDPFSYLDGIDRKKVAQIHLGGYSDMGDFLFDTHSKPVHEPVWQLFSHFIDRSPDTPVLIEWDDDIPDFQTVEKEVIRAKKICAQSRGLRLVK